MGGSDERKWREEKKRGMDERKREKRKGVEVEKIIRKKKRNKEGESGGISSESRGQGEERRIHR